MGWPRLLILLTVSSTVLVIAGLASAAEPRDTWVRQVGQPVCAQPGQQVEITVGLSARPGGGVRMMTALTGLVTMDVRKGQRWSRVETAQARGCYGGEEPYALAKFTLPVPAGARPGSTIKLRLQFAGTARFRSSEGRGELSIE